VTRLPAKRQSALPSAREGLERAVELAAEAYAPNTRKAYQTAMRAWIAYAEEHGFQVFPATPEAVAAWIGSMHAAGISRSTIKVRCAAVGRLHLDRDRNSPVDDVRVRKVLRGMVRGTEQGEGKQALTAEMVRRSLLDPDTKLRDKALLAVGFVTGMRRSELVSIRWSDVREHAGGFTIRVSGKVERKIGTRATVAIPEGLPSAVLREWREASGGRGRVFSCHAETVSNCVKRCARKAGKDPDLYGAHSLRAGLATTAAEAGVSLAVSMAATRHRSAEVAAGYVRPAEALRNEAFRAAVDALSRED
jgi:integrase